MYATDLKVDHLRDPIGLQNRQPLISWTCAGGVRQTAYSVVFYVNGEEKAHTGKTVSGSMCCKAPFSFSDRDCVSAEVTLWDENDSEGEARTASFEIGISNWEAKWIDPEPEHGKERQPASYLRRDFEIAKTGRARLYITAHGLYEAAINGKRVGEFILAPGTDDYGKRLQYQVYDVTDLLNEGTNRIEVIIADGWYRGNNGIDGINHLFGDDLSLLCQLEVDGEVMLISDEKWEASQDGPIRFSDMEIGEVYDARRESFDGWHAVKTAEWDKSVLVCSDEVIIKEQERFPGTRISTPDGSAVYDFGQNLAGYTCFEIDAKEGQRLTIWHGETLDKEGNFTQSNIEPGKRNRNGGIPQKVIYTCKEGRNVYKPRFSIFGFRYIKVETEADLESASFEAIAVYSAMERTAEFTCSNEDVNQLFRNSLWSTRSNFVDIPTDCPHRERSGWTGDAGVFAPTGSILFDSYSVFRKWLAECRLAQEKDGTVVNIAPPINRSGGISKFIDGSTGWGDAALLVPYALYQTYGDPSILEENYDMMKKWVGHLRKLAKKQKIRTLLKRDPHQEYIIEKGFHWGEWCQPDVDASTELRTNMTKGAPKSATAYYFYSTRLLSDIAEILGKKADAEEYRTLSDKIREAYIHTFTEDSVIRSDRQCDYVRPLQFGLVDKTEENARLLNEMIINNGYHLNTGFLSTPFICPVLCDHGYTDTAYKLLLQTSSPSWLYAVKQGATTIWENWNGFDNLNNGSLNHYSYGAVCKWLISGICGIQLNAGKLTFAPKPDRQLEFARAVWNSPVGTVCSEWQYDESGISYTFSVPANIQAELVLPDGSVRTLEPGTAEIHIQEI